MSLQLVGSSGDELVLNCLGKQRVVCGVTCHADYEVGVFLRLLLRGLEGLVVHYVELDVLSAVHKVGLYP